MQTNLPNKDMQLLRNVTRDYARYARNAAGLGNVLGGVLTLLMYAAGLTLDLGGAERMLLALLPLLWIGAKEGLRRAYYQRHGSVTEPLSPSERLWHTAITVVTALISLGVLVAFAANVRAG